MRIAGDTGGIMWGILWGIPGGDTDDDAATTTRRAGDDEPATTQGTGGRRRGDDDAATTWRRGDDAATTARRRRGDDAATRRGEESGEPFATGGTRGRRPMQKHSRTRSASASPRNTCDALRVRAVFLDCRGAYGSREVYLVFFGMALAKRWPLDPTRLLFQPVASGLGLGPSVQTWCGLRAQVLRCPEDAHP